MEIQKLGSYTQTQFEDLKLLMCQLTNKVNFSSIHLENVLADRNCRLYVIINDEHIIACATLCVFHSPTGTKASIEDVAVSSAFRGQHLGKKLMKFVLEQAKQLSPIEVHLTSNSKRVAANNLYQSLGFQKKETNCYQTSIVDGTTGQDNHEKLKQSITYLIGKERADGNVEPLTVEFISRALNADVVDVNHVLRELGLLEP